MFNLTDIRVINYLQLEKDAASAYVRLQKIMNPKNIFSGEEGKKYGELEYGQVKRLQKTFKSPTYEQVFDAFGLFFNASKHQVLRSRVTEFFPAINYIIDQISEAVEKENKSLSTKPNQDLENAGIGRLSAFGALNVIFDLAERFGKDPEEIERWQYRKVFAILLRDKIAREIKEEYSEITRKR